MGHKVSLDDDLSDDRYGFRCPGCRKYHQIPTSGSNAWGFNKNLESPTFTPSILVQGVGRMTDDEYDRIMKGEKIEPRPYVCHSFVTDGKIQFLGDCTHELAGQTVELADIDT